MKQRCFVNIFNYILVSIYGNINFNDPVRNICKASLFHTCALLRIHLSQTEDMANAVVQSRVDYAN